MAASTKTKAKDAGLKQQLAQARAQQAATAAILKVIARSPSNVQPVFDAIAASAMRLLGGRSAVVTQVVGDALHLAALTSTSDKGNKALARMFPMPLAVAGKSELFAGVARSGKVAFRSDVENDPTAPPEVKKMARARGFRSAIAVPMLRGATTIGTVNVTRPEPGPFTDHQINLLRSFADQAVIAIENARRFNREKEALERQTATAEILKVINRSPSDLKPTFKAILESTTRMCDSSIAALFLFDGKDLTCAAQHNTTPAFTKFLQKMRAPPSKETPTRLAALKRKLVIVADYLNDPRFKPSPNVVRERTRSSLAVPLLRDGALVGVITTWRREVRPFSSSQIELLQTFADQAVIAIENVRLFNETKEALERQTATAEILKVIASSPSDVQPVFDSIAERAATLCGARYAFVTSFDGELVHMRAFVGEGAAKHASHYPMKAGTGSIAARVARDGAPVQITDFLADKAYAQKGPVSEMGLRSGFGVPMMRGKEVLGSIVIGREQPGSIPDHLIGLLQSFASQAVIAIENVRLFNETRESLERQTATSEILASISGSMTDTQPVFDAIVRNLNRLFGTRFAILELLRDGIVDMPAVDGAPGFERLREHYPRPLDDTTVGGQAMLTKQTVRYAPVLENPAAPTGTVQGAKAYGFDSVIFTPMIHEGKVVGAIGTALPEARPFDQRQVELIKTFADQAVIAIENVRLFNETKESLERQTATAEILKVIASSPSDVQPVFDAIAASAKRLLSGGAALVARRAGDMLHLAAFTTQGEAADAATQKLWPSKLVGEGHMGKAVLSGGPVLISDIEVEPGYSEAFKAMARTRGLRSVVSVPMLREGEPIGVISVNRPVAGAFTDHQTNLLKTFADQAVIAIENVRLFNETKESLERQTATAEILKVISGSPTDVQPVFDVIARNAARVCDGILCGVFRFDGELLHFVAHHAFTAEGLAAVRSQFPRPPGRDNLGARSVLDRAVVHIRDLETDPDAPAASREVGRAFGYRSLLAVPMLRGNRALGFIAVARPSGGFADRQVELLRTFADQAVIAIENVRLFNETREALERQTATAEILRVIASSPSDVQPVFDAIASSAMQLIDGFSSAVVRVEGEVLHLAALTTTSDTGNEALKALFPLPISDRNNVSFVVRTRTPRVVTDIESDPETSELARTAARARGWRSGVAVPMLRDGQAIGAINVTRRTPGSFADHHVRLLQTFADQAVIAIENVRLFNETKEALERQTATADILKVIASSPADVQPVLDTVAASSARLCEASDAVVHLRQGDALRLAAHYGRQFSARPAGATTPLDRGWVMGRCALEGRQIHVHDLQAEIEDYPLGSANARKRGFRTMLATPLLREGKAIGAILIRRADVRPFSDTHLDLIRTFADQAVIAIENVRLFNETKEALEQQKASADVLGAISGSITDTKPVFDKILESCERLFEGNVVGVTLATADGKIDLAAYHGRDYDKLKSVYPLPLSRESGSGAAILDAAVAHYPDTEAPGVPPGVTAGCRTIGMRAIVFAPMLFEGRGVGAIWVGRSNVGKFTDKQVALLRTFADQAVIAIHNARLFNETREALERQTATGEILSSISGSMTDTKPVFEAIVRNLRRLFGANFAVVQVLRGDIIEMPALSGNEKFNELLERYPRPLDDSTIGGAVMLLKRAMQYSDVPGDPAAPQATKVFARDFGFNSVIFAPMLLGDKVIGAVGAARPEAKEFDEKQIALIKSFADQAVIAIENVRLFNETRESLERQTATAEILKVISSSPTDTQPVFEAIARSVVRLCDGLYTYLGLFDGTMIDFVAFHNVSPQALAIIKERFPSAPDAASSTGRAIRARAAIHIPDVMADAEYSFKDLARADGYRAILAVPMLREGNPIGVIAVGRRSPFSGDQIDLVKTFADQAVIAIENVRLFKELQARQEALTKSVGQLTALGEVGQAISSTLELDKVLQTIVSRAVQLTALDAGAIYEYDQASEQFSLQAAENMDPGLVEGVRNTPIRKGDGATGRTAVTLEAVQVPDVEDDSYQGSRKDGLARAGYRAVLAVPLLREDHLLGVLQVFRRNPGEFPPEVVELLKTFATQSAMAIQNARLFREIAEKGKQLEEASQHKSQFLASMSHELRTPLNAILGFNEMLLGQVYGDVPADMQEPLKDIQTSGKHLLRLINNVLDLAKIEAGRMELSLQDYSVHDTVESVRSTLRPLAAEKGLEFLTSVPNDVPLAYGDGGRITQCLMNLAGNSLKFTKAGKVEISAAARGDWLVYKVTDTGVGIPPDKIGSLFTEFKQTDATIASEYGGTGLGLSISRKFVEMHGGRIWVESELGRGSAFIFEVPLRLKTP